MTSGSIHRIRKSFELLKPRIIQMIGDFYHRMFEVLPESRAMFEVDMAIQQQHFAAALALIVRNLSIFDTIREPLRELGAEHAKFGVRPHHYPPVRDALLFAMARALGEAWSEQLREDWRNLLDLVAGEMLAGSQL
jgi:hemoglobin-like flavoprotein